MPRVGFESTTPVFKREKTVHASDCVATVIGKIEQDTWVKYFTELYVDESDNVW
jgi:hypothetical protein